MAQNADIQRSAISALKMFVDSRYADIEKSADIPISPMPILISARPYFCTQKFAVLQ